MRGTEFVPSWKVDHEMNPRSVSVVIVAFQSAHIIKKALDSIGPCGEIICFDNGSTDNIEAILPENINYIRSECNLGYTRACNKAADIAAGDFLLFMNPDVTLETGALEALLAARFRYPDADIFVPRTTLGDGTLWFHDSTSIERRSAPRAPRLNRQIVGDCCMRFADGGVFLIRRSVFIALGGFDESMFMYYEDEDFSLRLLEAGHKIVHVNDARAVHRIGSSSAPPLASLVRREFHKKRSEMYLLEKYDIKPRVEPEYVVLGAKIVFYSMSLRPKRALAAFGRLWGLVSYSRASTRSSANDLGRHNRSAPSKRSSAP
jgi:GT2 family glycosyltransferase